MIELAQGVRLHVIPTEKFKTISIKFKFKNKLNIETLTKRSMVARLLETNSEQYPSQIEFQSKLSSLYGSRFGSGVSKKGNYHIVSFAMNIVNEKFLKDQGIFEQAMEFFHQAIYRPNVLNTAFHRETFDREISNLKDDFDSIYDDKATYASIELAKIYFKDEAQKSLASGRVEDLKELSAENVYQAYREMVQEDELDIYIVGDVDSKAIQEQMSTYEYGDRSPVDVPAFYIQKNDDEVVNGEETQDITQAKLNLVYDTGVYYHGENYFAVQIFNGIFGGFPQSKLFMNVREKESLAYTAASRVDTFRGVLFVHTGIDSSKTQQVLDIVSKQLQDMQAGEFTDESINQTKAMIKNGLMQSDDSANSMIERDYALDLIDKEISMQEWMEKIDGVTKDEIIDVAKNIHLQATFLLRGE